jgi:uncharacterized membrane protein YgdD (TMEM256/DUF423 family)
MDDGEDDEFSDMSRTSGWSSVIPCKAWASEMTRCQIAVSALWAQLVPDFVLHALHGCAEMRQTITRVLQSRQTRRRQLLCHAQMVNVNAIICIAARAGTTWARALFYLGIALFRCLDLLLRLCQRVAPNLVRTGSAAEALLVPCTSTARGKVLAHC